MNTDLHLINLRERIADLVQCQTLLSLDEQKRMRQFATPQLQNNFALTRGHLRLTLAKYLQQDPSKIDFHYNEFGKPFIHNNPVQFNLAHSGDYAAIAVTEKDQIGVDIERCDRVHSPLEIAQRFFTPREASAIAKSLDPSPLFFHIWTQKEAFLKAIGKGIAFGLDQFEVSIDIDVAAITEIRDPEYAQQVWSSQNVNQIPGYWLVVTQENKMQHLQVYPRCYSN